MKSKYLILSVLGAISLSGCYEMDTEPLNQYLTDEQKTQAKEDNPDMAQGAVS